MTTKRIPMAAAAALLAVTLGATVAFAQSHQAPAPQQAPMPGKDMMMGQGAMDHGNMMDMAQMKTMMGNCNRMMESMQHSPSGAQGTSAPVPMQAPRPWTTVMQGMQGGGNG